MASIDSERNRLKKINIAASDCEYILMAKICNTERNIPASVPVHLNKIG